MEKSELLNRLQEEHQQWETLLDEIGPTRMDQPGVNGLWSVKDIVAHLAGWNRKLVASLQAAQRREPEPPPHWPTHLESDDDINAWIYESNRRCSVRDVLDESQHIHHELVAVIESLPADVRIEVVEPAYYLVWIDDTRYVASEFFNHFHDDHESDVRAWLAREEQR